MGSNDIERRSKDWKSYGSTLGQWSTEEEERLQSMCGVCGEYSARTEA